MASQEKYWIRPGVQCILMTGRGPVMTIMSLDAEVHRHRKTKKPVTIVKGAKCRWIEDGVERIEIFHTKHIKQYYPEPVKT